eukprot:scaffold7378_cov410-Prasinococcus_capsulatus_cf.AAC.9
MPGLLVSMCTASRSFQRVLTWIATGCLDRALHGSLDQKAKVLVALYDDPIDAATGRAYYPPPRVRDDIPVVPHYPDGQTTPTPRQVPLDERLHIAPYPSGRLRAEWA